MGRNDLKRNDFEKYKDAYTEKSMSELDVQKMKNRIEQAKQEKKAEQEKQAVAQKTNQRNTARKWYAVAAAAAIIIAVPNLLHLKYTGKSSRKSSLCHGKDSGIRKSVSDCHIPGLHL